jgi:hypothetical protein
MRWNLRLPAANRGICKASELHRLLADGGETIADLAVQRNQADLFGAVASDPTAWRLLSGVDGAVLARLRAVRAQARELAWAQAAETRTGLPDSTATGQSVLGLVLDLDATIVICHSENSPQPRRTTDVGPRVRHCGGGG